ncbi:MAG: hypothetical protein Q8903_15320 [Bacteroidota bacterium]|nr:hypothetical protein [Bacteroidota bacterium]
MDEKNFNDSLRNKPSGKNDLTFSIVQHKIILNRNISLDYEERLEMKEKFPSAESFQQQPESKIISTKTDHRLSKSAVWTLAYLAAIIVFWLANVVVQSDWVENCSALWLLVNAGIFAIPILAVALLGYLFKRIKRRVNTKSSIANLVLVFMVLIMHAAALIYNFSIYTVIGYATLVNKEMQGNSCYIYVANNDKTVKLKCTQQEYDRLIVNNKLAYGIEYKFSTYTPDKGILMNISLDKTIDNRNR